jgi:hypothetical protein
MKITMKTSASLLSLGIISLLLLACASLPSKDLDPQSRFMENLKSLCGKAFKGRLVSTDAVDSDLAKQELVMHVASCSHDKVSIPFHVGEDRSRTWVITKTNTGLRLKHDHRHKDGSEDELTQYGGDTASMGTDIRQEFPVDAFSIDLFNRTNRQVSSTNIWAVEIIPGKLFAYELRRANRHFRAEFDIGQPVSPPPAAWGHE